MGISWRDRLAFWLEQQPWAREFVLREDSDSAEFIEQPMRRMIRVIAVNRINGHNVVIVRRVNTWKRDGYLIAAWIGALLGALAQFGLTSLIEALT